MPAAGGLSLSRNEARLLLLFSNNHAYFLHEVAGGDKNNYKYIRDLADKGWIEAVQTPSYLPLHSGTQLPEFNLVRLADAGRLLRGAILEISLVDRQTNTRHLTITPNDFAVLTELASRDVSSERQLAERTGLAPASLAVSLARLSALGLAEKKRLILTADGRRLVQAIHTQAMPEAGDVCPRQPFVALPEAEQALLRGRDLFTHIVKCREILQILVGLRPGSRETVLILSDTTTNQLATLFATACDLLGVEHTFILMPPQAEMAQLPALVAAAVREAKVLMAVTRESIMYSPMILDRLKKETENQFRCANLYSPRPSWLSKWIITEADQLRKIQRASEDLADKISTWDRIKITSPGGTNLKVRRLPASQVSVQLGRCFDMHAKDVRYPKATANTSLLAGEVFFEVGDAEGVITFDGPCQIYPSEGPMPFTATVEAGRIVDVDAEPTIAARINAFLNRHPETRELTAVCIGTNEYINVSGDYVPDCKAKGTINLNFGGNQFVAGRRREGIPMASVLYTCEIIADGRSKLRCDGHHGVLAETQRRPRVATPI